MDEEQNNRQEKLGFKPQKELLCNLSLPYSDELDVESNELFSKIKENLMNSLLAQDFCNLELWCNKFNRFLSIYNLKFSKEDHIELIKIFFEIITIPNLSFDYLINIFPIYERLLKGKFLVHRDDLELPWRPLFEIKKRLAFKKEPSYHSIKLYEFVESIDNLIKLSRNFFPKSATSEILDEFRQYLCPFDQLNMAKGCYLLSLFLPTQTEYQLWFDEIITIWTTYHNTSNWEKHVVDLLSYLAYDNIGSIDWKPYVPFIFTRLACSLNLPVSLNNRKNGRVSYFNSSSMAIWIVSALENNNEIGENIVLEHLKVFIHRTETYLYHANRGKWSIRIKTFLKHLTRNLVKRIDFERRQLHKTCCKIKRSSSVCLNDDTLTEFVKILLPAVQNIIYDTTSDSEDILHHLAVLRADLIVPIALDRLYESLNSLTEPQKLIATLSKVTLLIQEICAGKNYNYPIGPTHIVPLLIALLPGIDPNDLAKSLVTFRFFERVTFYVPLIDCSQAPLYHTDLTDEEILTCEQTSQFEDFILQFIDRLFLLIDANTSELTRMEQTSNIKSRRFERVSFVDKMIILTFDNLFMKLVPQMSPEIFHRTLQKLKNHILTSTFGTPFNGKLVARVLHTFIHYNESETVNSFLPQIIADINELILESESSYATQETLDNNFLFKLRILSELCFCSSGVLKPYENDIIQIFDKLLYVQCQDAVALIQKSIKLMFLNLTVRFKIDMRSSQTPYDVSIKEHLFVRHWGETYDSKNMKFKISVPTYDDIKLVERILWRYIPKTLETLQNFTKDDVENILARTKIQNSLNLICSFLSCLTVLPFPDSSDENEKNLIKFKTFLIDACITMPDGSNVIEAIINAIEKLQNQIFHSSDTESLKCISKIYFYILKKMPPNLCFKECNFNSPKKLNLVLTDKLQLYRLKSKIDIKRYTPRLTYCWNLLLQHFIRYYESESAFTSMHLRIFELLFNLSFNYYAEVRSVAQQDMIEILNHFKHDQSKIIEYVVPRILKILQSDPNENHEEFKAVLFILNNETFVTNLLRFNYDWSILLELCPALIKSKLSEKDTVINLFAKFKNTFEKCYVRVNIKMNVPESCLNLVKTSSLWSNTPKVFTSKIDLELAKQGADKMNLLRLDRYNSLGNTLVSVMENNNLHWRHQMLLLTFLKYMKHIDVNYNLNTVKLISQTLIHYSFDLRCMALIGMKYVLKQISENRKKKVQIPLEEVFRMHNIEYTNQPIQPGNHRKDNFWLQYDSHLNLDSDEKWKQHLFVHKAYIGYHNWPKQIQTCVVEQYNVESIDSIDQVEKIVYDFFMNENNLNKLIEYYSLEENNQQDRICPFKIHIFKYVFCIYGDAHLKLFLTHVERLIRSRKEKDQRCALEILIGIITGAKYWSYVKLKQLWETLTPILKVGFENIIVETMYDWAQFFSTVSRHRDPNHLKWLYELLMDSPLEKQEPSFIKSTRLSSLHGIFSQQLWRTSEIQHRIVHYIENHLVQSLEIVRTQISSVLSSCCELDIVFPKNGAITNYLPGIPKEINYIPTNGNNAIRTISPHMDIIMEKLIPNFQYFINIQQTENIKMFFSDDKSHNIDVEPQDLNELFKQKLTLCLNKISKNSFGNSSENTLNLNLNIIQQYLSNSSDQSIVEDINLDSKDKIVKQEDDNNLKSTVANETEQVSIKLMQITFKWVINLLCRQHYNSVLPFYRVFRLASYMYTNDVIDNSINILSHELLAMLGQANHPKHELSQVLTYISDITSPGPLWTVRQTTAEYLEFFVFHNMGILFDDKSLIRQVKEIVLVLLNDEFVEVRKTASKVLSSLIHSHFFENHEGLLDEFKKQVSKNKVKKNSSPVVLRQQHSAVLGLCALIQANPYTIPSYLPSIFLLLDRHINDPEPISSTIIQCLSNFKRTHQNTWEISKMLFTEEELNVLNDLVVTPSYFA